MKFQLRSILLSVVGILMLSIASCDPHRDVDPILPNETAVLLITFSPSPVYESSSGKFEFIVFVDEINNVDAWLTSVKIELLDDEGEVIDVDRHDEAWLTRTFGTSYIEPLGRIMGHIKLEAYSGTRENWILRGHDEQNNAIEYSQSVELIRR